MKIPNKFHICALFFGVLVFTTSTWGQIEFDPRQIPDLESTTLTTNTDNFDTHLSAADTNVQLALDTLDDLAAGHADGTNCSAGSYNLGVDGDGNAQDCTPDADTQLDKAGVEALGILHSSTTGQTATDHHTAPSGNAIIDWTADQGATNINAGNYTDNDTTYSVGDGGLTTNDFTTADHDKLDGVELLADVTDVTNVTAAGALMDSEVTNLTQVKAFDTTDYATAAQGTLADSAVQDTGAETIAGVKTFSSSPIVPAPTTDLQAATKKYVDDNAGGGALSDLSDVNTSTPTDKNVLVADGVDFESRPLVIGDISDFGDHESIGVSAYLTSDEATAIGVAETLDTFTEEWDLGSDFNAATGIFTAPVAGKYTITVLTRYAVAGDQDAIRTAININGASGSVYGGGASGANFQTAGGTKTFDLAATDTVSVTVQNITSIDNIVSGATNTYIAIKYDKPSVIALGADTVAIGVSATVSAATTLTAGVNAKVVFDSENWDLGSDMASGTFTAPVAGKYRVSGQLRFLVALDQDGLFVIPYVNGTANNNAIYSPSSGVGNQTVPFNVVLDLAANDTVEIYAQNQTTNDSISATANHSFINITHVGQGYVAIGADVVQTGVKAWNSSSVTLPSNVSTKVTFGTELWDYGNDFASSTFTAPTTENYRISGSIRFAAGTDQDQQIIRISVNATTASFKMRTLSGTAAQSNSFDEEFALNAGDTLEVYAQSNTASSTVATQVQTYVQIAPLGQGYVGTNDGFRPVMAMLGINSTAQSVNATSRTELDFLENTGEYYVDSGITHSTSTNPERIYVDSTSRCEVYGGIGVVSATPTGNYRYQGETSIAINGGGARDSYGNGYIRSTSGADSSSIQVIDSFDMTAGQYFTVGIARTNTTTGDATTDTDKTKVMVKCWAN